MERKTLKPLSFFPPADGKGKWHVSNAVGGVAACGCGVILDARSGRRIQIAAVSAKFPLAASKS